eukprot:409609-Pleurochrysis_carterae.AAC.1
MSLGAFSRRTTDVRGREWSVTRTRVGKVEHGSSARRVESQKLPQNRVRQRAVQQRRGSEERLSGQKHNYMSGT